MKSQCKTSPIWTDINKIPARYPWLDFNESCEVCVIGGGITGALTALQLATVGVDTVLVTDRPLGFGAASLAPSWCRYDSVGTLNSLIEKVGTSTASQVYSAQKKALEKLGIFAKKSSIDFGFELRDCILYTNDPTEKQNMFREYQLRKNCGFDVEFAGKTTLQDIFPFETECAIISKELAAELDPYRLTHAAASEAQKNGARVYENTKVTAISESSGKCTVKTSTRRKITASKIVLTIGKECSDYVSGLGRMRSCASAVSKPLNFFDGWPGKCVITCIDNPSFTVASTPDDRLFISGMASSALDENGKIKGILPAGGIAQKRYDLLKDTAYELFPRLSLEFEYEFCTCHSATFAGMPVIDSHPEHQNCCFAVSGGMPSALAGTTAASVISGICSGAFACSPFAMRRN